MAFVFTLRKIPLFGEKMWKEGAGHRLSLSDTQLHPLERVFELLFSELSWEAVKLHSHAADRQEGTNNGGHVWDTRLLMLDLGAGNHFFE